MQTKDKPNFKVSPRLKTIFERFQKQKQSFQALFDNLNDKLKMKYELDNACIDKMANFFAERKRKGKNRSKVSFTCLQM